MKPGVEKLVPVGSSGVTYDVLNVLLRITPKWKGFDRFRFHLSTCSLDYALRNFISCWDRRSTFHDLQNALRRERVVGGFKSEAMAANFDMSKALFVVGFERRLLRKFNSKTFPVGQGKPSDIIIADGNHRLTAHAVRRKLKLAPQAENIVVGLWVGRELVRRGKSEGGR